ncbi:MAG: hypothetical protein DRO67_08590 [Candidatus Asgardarchaeum californiense]|nr:MAG: hypothetical protein DRO67_08590 [Candidatus Asgardarchaeum californiense]
MKKLFLVSVILILGLSWNLLNAQTGWIAQTNPLGLGEDAMIGKVQFVNQTEGWIAANGGRFLHTLDGGSNWVVVDPFPDDTVWNFSDPATDMCWINQSYGWRLNILGSSFSDSRGALLYKTTDGGTNWTKKYVSTKDSVVAAQVEFVDQNYGWIVLYDLTLGERSILRSTDGGNNWNNANIDSPDGAWLDFVDQNNGWLITTSPHPPYEIQRTTDGGINWTTQYTFNGTSLDSSGFDYIFFPDVNNGWVVGDNGKVMKTTNGGANWDIVTNSGVNTNEEGKTVFFLDANIGWIPSKTDLGEPYVQHTTDGGASWITQQTPLADPNGYNAIFSINFVDAQTGWLTADYGRIAKYTWITDVDNDITNVNEFLLKQNYPNPFNPTTTIKYDIREISFVSLKAYDVLGSEITTLVNEEKPVGTYEVVFNASQYPSGIYFYRLQTGNFVETKKMILLK